MYVSGNPKTKKQLKEWLTTCRKCGKPEADALHGAPAPMTSGAVMGQHAYVKREVCIFSPGPFPAPTNGTAYVEGPHYPEPHKWYAKVEVKDGVIVKVS